MSALAELQPAVDLPNDSIQVLILDSHAITRIGLAVLLQRQPWVSRCLLAAERDAAAELAARHRPEVAIVDVSNAGPFAAAEVAPLRAAHRAMPIVLSSRTRAAAAVPPTALDASASSAPTAHRLRSCAQSVVRWSANTNTRVASRVSRLRRHAVLASASGKCSHCCQPARRTGRSQR